MQTSYNKRGTTPHKDKKTNHFGKTLLAGHNTCRIALRLNAVSVKLMPPFNNQRVRKT